MFGQDSKDVSASGSTGSVVQRTGPYKCNSHGEIIVFFKKGDKFAACPAKNHATTWSMVKSS